ncbi:MAG: ribosome recycling factor [Pseudomonadota bacterium]
MADDADLEPDIDDINRRMEGALTSLKGDFSSLRTGRASTSMLDAVEVEAYGQMTPLNQVGTINVPEPRMVTINVWDKQMVGKVDKAIRSSGLGLNPVMDGQVLRLPIPELNEERRKELAKLAGQYAEKARVAIRNVRRDGMDQVKKAKAGGMAEDDQKFWSDEIQKVTDQAIKSVDGALETKQAEIMQV